MEALAIRWRVRHGRDPEMELRRLKRGFRAGSWRHERAVKLHRLYRWAKISAVAAQSAPLSSIWA